MSEIKKQGKPEEGKEDLAPEPADPTAFKGEAVDEGTAALLKERAALQAKERELKESLPAEAAAAISDVLSEKKEPLEPIPDNAHPSMEGLTPLQKAARRGQARIDPRRLEEMQREGNWLDLGEHENRLDLSAYADQLDGYHTHWANNDGNRIIELLEMGYEPVYQHGMERALGEEINESLDSWVSQRMGTMKDGKPLIVYALKIRNDAWEARQAAKRARIKETEDAIRNGTIGQQADDNRYLKHVNITR